MVCVPLYLFNHSVPWVAQKVSLLRLIATDLEYQVVFRRGLYSTLIIFERSFTVKFRLIVILMFRDPPQTRKLTCLPTGVPDMQHNHLSLLQLLALKQLYMPHRMVCSANRSDFACIGAYPAEHHSAASQTMRIVPHTPILSASPRSSSHTLDGSLGLVA